MDNNELDLMDRRMGEASVLSMEICDLPIHSNTLDARILQDDTEWLRQFTECEGQYNSD